jgi:polysaccharide deacetylase family protein (PEP-CTERM system associated)
MDATRSGKTQPINAMTVDVEDYFQVSAFESRVNRTDWDNLPCRIEKNIDSILQLFDSAGIKATFFTLGWIAERYPDMVKRIVQQGHELASHGWQHVRVTEQKPKGFREDVRRTKIFLEDLSGLEVKGYRAASYSINASNIWALDELADAGYRYSSSIVPIRHDLYGMPEAPRFRFTAAEGRLLEIPITTVQFSGRNINCGGGGWFRLFPYAFSRWALRRVNTQEQESCIFYFHPWEIDPGQPRLDKISAKTQFRHYLNLAKMYGRLEKLLEDFEWGRMDDIFLPEQTER